MDLITTAANIIKSFRVDPALRADMSILEGKLSTSELLIERCEWWRFKFKVIDDLLPQLKNIAYEAQTLLNEFHYQKSKRQIDTQNMSFAGQLISSSHTNFINWWTGYPTKVKEAHEKLERVYDRLKEACDGNDVPENPNQFSRTARPETSSFITEPKVYGRDKELNEVISLLGVLLKRKNGTRRKIDKNDFPETSGVKRKENVRTGITKRQKIDQGVDMPENSGVKIKENVSVLPIVGIGGVGKTTLAQMVCNNKIVMSYFELIIWVCVSDKFDIVRLIQEIIMCAKKDVCNVNNLNFLQVKLKEALESRRFLLVLDDIWSENKADWQKLFTPIKEGCAGSMVIVTTRSPKVAEITGTCQMGPVFLEGLEEEVYWEFFKSCAFGLETNSENYPELEAIGKQIVVKLKGFPLAAKTLGSLLSTNLDVGHWRNIRDSEMWELQQGEDGILPVLQLSYQYLPFHLKKCFSFCSLYPKDYRFTESELTQFWICLNLINSQENQPMELVAKGYIHEFVSRCFFQTAENSSDKYVIHDLMHDVAQSITKDECFRIENEDFEQKISPDIRHLSIFNCKLKQEKFKKLCRYKKLHSLIIQGDTPCVKAVESWFDELANICYLSLPNCKIKKLPANIGNLKHLRSLNISGAEIAQLPDSFCELYNLKYLYMEKCYDLQCFPEGSNRLVKMQFLKITNIQLVGHIINLSSAVQLGEVHFCINKKSGEMAETLKYMNKLYGTIGIYRLEDVSSMREAEQAQLENKKFVHSLKLFWWSFDTNDNTELHHEVVLQGLRPHPNLKEIKIDEYKGAVLSSWLETNRLTNLIKLELSWCRRLTSLENCLVPGNFPALKEINIWKCEELVFVPVENFIGFVSLKQLTIKDCPKLTCQKEAVLPPLQKLHLVSCGDLVYSLFPCLHNLTSLTYLHIGDCPNLSYPRNMAVPPSLSEWFFSGLQNLTSLNRLEISDCQGITSIPVSVTSCLKSLEVLTVRCCSELQSLGGKKFLASLKEIHITECPKLQETKGKDMYRK